MIQTIHFTIYSALNMNCILTFDYKWAGLCVLCTSPHINNCMSDQILVILPENCFAFSTDEVVYCLLAYCLLVYWLCGYECVHMCFGLWECVCANVELSVCLDWRGYKQLCFYGEHKGNKFVFIRMCVSGCVTYLNFCGQNWWTSVPTIWLNLLVPQRIIMYLINAKSFVDRFVYI